MESGEQQARKRSRRVLIALFAIFFIPVFSAMLIAILAPHWVPFGSINKGELVQPPIAGVLQGFKPVQGLPTNRLPTPPAAPRTDEPWSIVHVSDGNCDEHCEYALTQMRQARLALGKDAHRVQRWWLLAKSLPNEAIVEVMNTFPGLRVATIDQASPLYPTAQPQPIVQMIDPRGFLMMRYRHQPSVKEQLASDLLKDFKRLLKISKQG